MFSQSMEVNEKSCAECQSDIIIKSLDYNYICAVAALLCDNDCLLNNETFDVLLKSINQNVHLKQHDRLTFVITQLKLFEVIIKSAQCEER